MDNNISYTNTDLGIKYNKLVQPQISTGVPFSIEPYQVENGELKKYPLPLINATDINWGGVNINNSEINTTDDLLHLISTKGTANSDIDIDGNTILGVMLNAIRALQAEVVKLRNSFKYGITSYKDTKTTMSNVLHEYSDITPEEPLWATDESELSGIEGFNFEDPRQFSFTGDVLNGADNDEYVQINGQGIWEDTTNQLKDIDDPKVYCYLTTNSLNFSVKLKTVNYNSEYKLDEENIQYKEIDFSTLGVRESVNGKYNILIILGRKQLDNKQLYGNNFIWIGIAD